MGYPGASEVADSTGNNRPGSLDLVKIMFCFKKFYE